MPVGSVGTSPSPTVRGSSDGGPPSSSPTEEKGGGEGNTNPNSFAREGGERPAAGNESASSTPKSASPLFTSGRLGGARSLSLSESGGGGGSITNSAGMITFSPMESCPGGPIKVCWTLKEASNPSDWLGLFSTASPNSNPAEHAYMRKFKGCYNGEAIFHAPPPGDYEFRYIRSLFPYDTLTQNYLDVVRSGILTVVLAVSRTSSIDGVSVSRNSSLEDTAPASLSPRVSCPSPELPRECSREVSRTSSGEKNGSAVQRTGSQQRGEVESAGRIVWKWWQRQKVRPSVMDELELHLLATDKSSLNEQRAALKFFEVLVTKPTGRLELVGQKGHLVLLRMCSSTHAEIHTVAIRLLDILCGGTGRQETRELMQDENNRIFSFNEHWPHAGTSLTAERMAAAGLYFSPTGETPDRCVCYMCQGSLLEWNPITDDPWREHVRWYSGCALVQKRLVQGEDGASNESLSAGQELRATVERDVFSSEHFPVIAHLASAANPRARKSAVSVLTSICDILDESQRHRFVRIALGPLCELLHKETDIGQLIMATRALSILSKCSDLSEFMLDVGTIPALLSCTNRMRGSQPFSASIMQTLSQLVHVGPPPSTLLAALLVVLKESRSYGFDAVAWACRALLNGAREHEFFRKGLRESSALKVLTEVICKWQTGEIAVDLARTFALLPDLESEQYFFDLAGAGGFPLIVTLSKFNVHRDISVQRFVARTISVLCSHYLQCLVCSKQPIPCQPGPPAVRRYYCSVCMECNLCDSCYQQDSAAGVQHLHEGRSYMVSSTTMEWQQQVLHNDGLDILVAMLQHNDRVVHEHALKAIYDIAQNIRHARRLLDAGVVPHVANMLLREDNESTQRLAAQTLASLCADEEVKVAIREHYVVPALCTLCAPSHSEAMRYAGVTALCKLAEPATVAQPLQAQVRAREWAAGDLEKGGGLEVLLREATCKEPETQRAAALALRHLCHLGMPALLQGVVQQSRLQPILSLVYSDRSSTSRLGLEVLAHMSEVAINRRKLFLSGIMFAVVKNAGTSDMKLQELACRILLNLAMDEENCRDITGDNTMAVKVMLDLGRLATDPTVQLLAISALKQLSTCQENLEKQFAVPDMLDFLRHLVAPGEKETLRKLGVEIICTLSNCPLIRKDRSMNQVLVELSRDSDAEIAQMVGSVITERLLAQNVGTGAGGNSSSSSRALGDVTGKTNIFGGSVSHGTSINTSRLHHSHTGPPSPTSTRSSESETAFSPSGSVASGGGGTVGGGAAEARKVLIKCVFEQAKDERQVKLFSFSPDGLTFEHLNERITSNFGDCVISFRDEEGDMVVISNDDDLHIVTETVVDTRHTLKLTLAPDPKKHRRIPSTPVAVGGGGLMTAGNNIFAVGHQAPHQFPVTHHGGSGAAAGVGTSNSSYPRIGSGVLGGHGFVFPVPAPFPAAAAAVVASGQSSMFESVSSIAKSTSGSKNKAAGISGVGGNVVLGAGMDVHNKKVPIVHSLLSDTRRKTGTLRWQKGQILGRGAFGEVYEALCVDTGELIAVKQIPLPVEDGLGDEGIASALKAVNNFEREVAFMRDLEHKHIVKYLGTDKSGGKLNIFLEYVSGGSIEALLRRYGPFDEATVRTFTRQTLYGLDYLHRKGIVHCDIKGGNLLVADGIIKLADFNACQRLWDIAGGKKAGDSSAASLRGLVGTPYFMAPEVVRQSGHGKKADIWSLGCTIIQMLTASLPWGEHSAELPLLFKIAMTKAPPPFPPHCSEEAKSFLQACFTINPTERPSAAELLLHPFLCPPTELNSQIVEEEDIPAVQRSRSLPGPFVSSSSESNDGGERRGTLTDR